MPEKHKRKTPLNLPYPRRESSRTRADLEPLPGQAPGVPLSPCPGGLLHPAPAPDQGVEHPHPVLSIDQLNLEQLQDNLRDIGEVVTEHSSDQEDSSQYEDVLDTSSDLLNQEQVLDLTEAAPEDDAEVPAQADISNPMAASLRTKLETLKQEVTVKTATIRVFLAKDPATSSSKRQAPQVTW